MSKSIFSAAHFNNEEAAYAYVEAKLWPSGPVCPHCGVIGTAGRLKGKSNRPGLWKCYSCRKPFSVKVGTIFESSHIAMRDWLTAIHLICSSKKGISANQLHRTLGITLKSAWFMAHRIREAITPKNPPPIGGNGQTVEVDETYIGRRQGQTVAPGGAHKIAILSLVERKGRIRSFKIGKTTNKTVHPVLRENVALRSTLYTDDTNVYKQDLGFKHESVNHSGGQYVRYENGIKIHTNSVKGSFSIFKRGMIGIYQHCCEQHLQRYLNEFDFRYSNRAKPGVNDTMRAEIALAGAVGKRLTYRTTVRA